MAQQPLLRSLIVYKEKPSWTLPHITHRVSSRRITRLTENENRKNESVAERLCVFEVMADFSVRTQIT